MDLGQVDQIPYCHRRKDTLIRSCADNRLGVAEFTLPPKTAGPPAHWYFVISHPKNP